MLLRQQAIASVHWQYEPPQSTSQSQYSEGGRPGHCTPEDGSLLQLQHDERIL